jgi:hypothetical protein
MRSGSTPIRLMALLVALLLLPDLAWPQASTATVSGTVRDQTGAVIPGSQVVLLNTATNVSLRTTTNEAGLYRFAGVVPGPYRLSVEATGFQPFEATLTVMVQQSAVVDPVMRIGATATEIDVLDVTPLLTVDSPALGQTLERTRIEQLPINGRNVDALLSTIPGMEGMRAYGLRGGSQEFVLDGAAQTDKLWGGMMSRRPGLDSIQEFKVEVNSSSAKFTRPTSVIMSTKSGTNEFHGSLFETHRNNGIGKARRRQDFYDKAPPLIRNEFGASAGGPVLLPGIYDGRNRTFFFAAYEATRNINYNTGNARVFTEAMRQGDFSGLIDSQGRLQTLYDPWTTDTTTWTRQPFAYGGKLNVIDPQRLSPVAKALYEVTPLPTHPQNNPLIQDNWYGPMENRRRDWTVTARFDHRFTDNDLFYVRLSDADYYSFNTQANNRVATLDKVANFNKVYAPNRSLAASWVRTISPTLFNEVLFSAQKQQWWEGTGEPDGFYADKLGLPNPFGSPDWPRIGNTGLSNMIYQGTNTKASRFAYFILDNNTTKIHGKHELMFGAHFRYDQLTVLPDQQQVAGGHTFSTLATALYDPSTSRDNPLATPLTGHDTANMYLGVMNFTNQFSRGNFYMRAREYAVYFQDNWKVTPRLTLNLGMRWERWPAYSEKQNLLTSFDPQTHSTVLGAPVDQLIRAGATLPSLVNRLNELGVKFTTYDQAGLPRNMMTAPWTNFGPRLGFAYRVTEGRRSVVLRGGFRTSYFPVPLRGFTARMRLNAPMTAWFTNDRYTGSSRSPDGIARWGMRAAPDVIGGVNSRDQISLDDASGLQRGWAINTTYFAKDQPEPRVHDWNLTLESEIMPSTVVRAAYVGNHGSKLEQLYSYNEPTPTYIWYATTGLPTPTGEYSDVARRPFNNQVLGSIEEYRKSGWSNYQGFQLELERRYSKGIAFQVFYNMNNALIAGGEDWNNPIYSENMYLPGAVPKDLKARNRFLNYRRDINIPKHRLRWNWIVDLPFGKGQRFGRNAGGLLDKVIGGWQIAGMGYLRSNYFSLPTDRYPTGEKVEIYGYKYPIEDCRGGDCIPGYLWWNGYIPANQINSYDANGRPNGIMGVPENYKPAIAPLIPWPENPIPGDPLAPYYGTNTVWVPMKDGSLERIAYDDRLHPLRNQFFPSVRSWNVDASLFKQIPIGERFRVRFNADFFNVLNIPGNPNSVNNMGVLETRNSGQGARELQLTLRVSW